MRGSGGYLFPAILGLFLLCLVIVIHGIFSLAVFGCCGGRDHDPCCVRYSAGYSLCSSYCYTLLLFLGWDRPYYIGGGTWWDNLVWNHSSGIEKWPRPHEHPAGMKCGFGLGQTLPSGFGDGNMVDRKGGISRIFTCFHQEEQTYSVIQLHIKSRHVHWRKESKVAAWWYCGDPIYSWQWCMLGDVRLWFRGWVDQRSWKGSPLRIQVNCFTRLRSVSFSWFQNYPAKTTVGVFFKAGLALIKTSGLPGLWSSPYTPLL